MFRNYYFINKFETKNIDKLDKKTIIIYRDYSSKLLNEELILKIKKYCKKKSIKFYLSNNIKLALKLNLDGAYIPSFNKSLKHLTFSLKKNFDIVGSAHNVKEIRTKEIQNVSKIFLSSLFKKIIKENFHYFMNQILQAYLILNKKKAPKKGALFKFIVLK